MKPEQVTQRLFEIPVGVDRDVDCGVRGGVFRRDQKYHFSAAREFAQQVSSVEKPRVRHRFGWSLIGCHLREVGRGYRGVSTYIR